MVYIYIYIYTYKIVIYFCFTHMNKVFITINHY